MSEPGKAIFLSYASQDAEAAKKICDSLRAAGIEVWFDQSELVGGDQWDQKIRGQVKSCALFVPVISANTQARLEGYFRLEWKLAALRTHTMADAKPFLLPVVIDATRDAEAHVPEEFRAVQWSRLAGGETIVAFAARVKTLLGGSVVGLVADRAPDQRSGLQVAKAPSSQKPFALIAASFALVVAIGAALLVTKKSSPPAASDKSIAVLPFTNLSTEKDNEFFADGIHADVLANLQNIRELRVLSPQSVAGYRDTKKSTPELARELGVSYLLAGSVQRAGDTVRVAAQLIDARTDSTVWSPQPYTKKLTDVFVIQSEIAEAIAAALRTTLSPQEKSLITRRPTDNPAAYDAYLKGRAVPRGRTAGTQLQAQEALFQRAVDLDPKFAEAWGELAVVHGQYVARTLDYSPARIAKSDAAIAQAIALAPDSPEVLRLQGRTLADARRDYARATEAFEKLTRLQPNDPLAWGELATTERSRLNWSQALTHTRKAVQLDQANISLARQLVSILAFARRWDEAIAEQRRLLKLQPNDLELQGTLAFLPFQATGDTKPMEVFFAGLSPTQSGSSEMMLARKFWDFQRGDLPHFIQLDRVFPYDPELFTLETNPYLHAHTQMSAFAFLAHGDAAGAKARLGDLVEKLDQDLTKQPNNEGLRISLALYAAVLGQREQALEAIQRCFELSAAQSGLGRPYSTWRINAAIAKIWVGEKDSALAELTQLLQEPALTLFTGGPLSVHVLRANPLFKPLKGDPRWEKVLSDPKNNAPLF